MIAGNYFKNQAITGEESFGRENIGLNFISERS